MQRGKLVATILGRATYSCIIATYNDIYHDVCYAMKIRHGIRGHSRALVYTESLQYNMHHIY